MGACNDCGAAIASVKEIVAHQKKVHVGSPRARFWDGQKETILDVDDGVDVTPRFSSSSGSTPVAEWDVYVKRKQKKAEQEVS